MPSTPHTSVPRDHVDSHANNHSSPLAGTDSTSDETLSTQDYSSVFSGHEKNTTQPGEWKLHLKSPVYMALMFVSATCCAFGHHYYYSKLDGTVVVNTPTGSRWDMDAIKHSQEWKIRFGTALAFLVQTLFAGALGIAFQQRLWVTTRRKAVTLDGLNAMFSAIGNFFSLFHLEFLTKAKLGALLALLVWLMPLSALITPATLTVVPSTTSYTKTMHVPAIDFSNFEPLLDFVTTVATSDGTTENNGITPYMSRMVSSLASSAKILPMSRAIANSTYNLTFHGPSLRCHDASPSVKLAIQLTNNATSFISGSGYFNVSTNVSELADSTPWVAFAPTADIFEAVYKADESPLTNSSLSMTFLSFARSCLIAPAMSDDFMPSFDGFELCTGIVTPSYGNMTLKEVSSTKEANCGQLWVLSQGSTYNCILTDTEYSVGFSYSSSDKMQVVDPDYDFRWTENDIYGTYFSVASALTNLLTGTLDAFNYGIMSSKTRVADTAIFGAFKANHSGTKVFSDITQPPEIVALAQNKSVGEVIEQLSRNVTLSLFSADKVLSLNTTKARVKITSNVNVYSYNRSSLIFTYAATFAVSLFGVIVGFMSCLRNGVSYDNTFSTFMLTTRNHRLDALAVGNSLGAMPLDRRLQKEELRFGILRDDKMGRVGFGSSEQVKPLSNGDVYY